ncbi:hypothetical protein CAEBREN_09536 [Caenorhabditis brenneri]|uniref:Uncharacterized protein n=1 Tax=Caenorhabditis brenneri TaxID=135651 RepID=G0N851_CAEBE|nr:hypothetical protein CAEBREN_09536 [Caenorhabditis brenneri]
MEKKSPSFLCSIFGHFHTRKIPKSHEIIQIFSSLCCFSHSSSAFIQGLIALGGTLK